MANDEGVLKTVSVINWAVEDYHCAWLATVIK